MEVYDCSLFLERQNSFVVKALKNQVLWVQFLALPQTFYVTLGKLLNCSMPQFPICERWITILFSSVLRGKLSKAGPVQHLTQEIPDLK